MAFPLEFHDKYASRRTLWSDSEGVNISYNDYK